MTKTRTLIAAGLMMLLAGHAAAHHNWAALYDVNSDIEIEGVISSIVWRNPHVRISFTVDAGSASEKVYTTESNSVAALARMNITKDVLTVGTKVRVAGYRSRSRDDGLFMNHLLLPDGHEIVFLRTAEPRWPESSRIGNTDRAHGRVVENDFAKRPTSIFAVWNTIFGAEGSHRALTFPKNGFSIDYKTERGSGSCATKDVWEAMGSPYPMQLINKGDTVIIHSEEFDTIREVRMGIPHDDPGIHTNNLGYSTGRMDDGRLLVTTSFEGSNSPLLLHETFALSADHNRLLYTSTLLNPDANIEPVVNNKWWQYQPGAFVQPYDCEAPEAAPTEQIEVNKAVIRQYLEAMGSAEFAALAEDLEAANHKQLRHEFENLKYNADDPKLAAMMQPELEAITHRTNTITRFIAEGDTVAATLRITGTHSGNLYGIPATGKAFEIVSGAIFKLNNGKITESWFMAEEARLLRQLGARLPARQDGKVILPPVYHDTRTYDEALQELESDPADTAEYQHKRLLLSYKAKNKPADYQFTGRPYSNLVRGGIPNIVERGAELGVAGAHGQSMSERRDMVGTIIAEGNLAMMSFRLTAVNSGPLYGIPASGNKLHDWELGFAEFDGDKWVDAWWMADELGFLLTIGNQEALDFLVGE